MGSFPRKTLEVKKSPLSKHPSSIQINQIGKKKKRTKPVQKPLRVTMKLLSLLLVSTLAVVASAAAVPAEEHAAGQC